MYMGGCYALTIGHVITITQWRVAVAAFGGKSVSPLGKILPSATLTIYIILVVAFVPVEQTRCISILGGLLLTAIILTIYMTTNKAIQAHGPTANCSRVRLAWSCFFFSIFVAISFSVTQKVIFIPWGGGVVVVYIAAQIHFVCRDSSVRVMPLGRRKTRLFSVKVTGQIS